MMLPSGNDAAQTLALHFGLLLLKERYTLYKRDKQSLRAPLPDCEMSQIKEILRIDLKSYMHLDDNREDIMEQGLREFYKEMNRKAQELRLCDTQYCSAHGMHHDGNYSSASDIARLSFYCMKNPTFRQIVRTQKYSCESRVAHGVLYQWQNTNKLLEQPGYTGLKTGITPTAGPCLAASL